MKKLKSALFWVEDLARGVVAGGLAARMAAAGMIALLMFVDFKNLYSMFTSAQANTPARDAFWYALTLCLALEGQPTVLGMNLSKLTDKTRHKANEKTGAIVGCAVSGMGTLLVFGVFLYIKSLEIAAAGGKEAFLEGAYPVSAVSYIVQVLLMCSPIITSMMAFVVSWCFFSSEASRRLERETENARRRLRHAERRWLHQTERLQLLRTQLWAKVSAGAVMPDTLKAYREAVCLRIRNLIVENVIALFPAMVGRYEQAVENRLQQAVQEMARHSSIPLTIQTMDLAEVIGRYNDSQPDDGMAWDAARALPVLQTNLKRGVDNAVVHAQTRILRGTAAEHR